MHRAYTGETQKPLPQRPVKLSFAHYGRSEITTAKKKLAEAIEDLCYGYLEQEHGGWENNDGAFGDFTLDVAAQTVKLEFNARFTDCTTSNHTW